MPSDPQEQEGWIELGGHRTWYRVVGELTSGKEPLLCLHGGPGSTHHYFAPLERLARLPNERPSSAEVWRETAVRRLRPGSPRRS